MPESLHALLQATRDDIRADMAAIRRELAESRQETARLTSEVARLATEAAATRRELDHHRDDDRQRMAELSDDLDDARGRVDKLEARERWLAGVLAVLTGVVTLVGAPVAVAYLLEIISRTG